MRDQDTEWGLTLNRSASCGITDKRSRSTLRPSLAMSTPSISIFPLLISTMRNSVSIMEDFPAPVLQSADNQRAATGRPSPNVPANHSDLFSCADRDREVVKNWRKLGTVRHDDVGEFDRASAGPGRGRLRRCDVASRFLLNRRCVVVEALNR